MYFQCMWIYESYISKMLLLDFLVTNDNSLQSICGLKTDQYSIYIV